MRCEEVRALLNDMIDGELDQRRRAAVEKHISECESCRQEKRRLERVVGLLRSLPREKVPVDLLPALRASRVSLGLGRTVAAVATIAAAVLVAVVVVPLLTEPTVREGPAPALTPPEAPPSKAPQTPEKHATAAKALPSAPKSTDKNRAFVRQEGLESAPWRAKAAPAKKGLGAMKQKGAQKPSVPPVAPGAAVASAEKPAARKECEKKEGVDEGEAAPYLKEKSGAVARRRPLAEAKKKAQRVGAPVRRAKKDMFDRFGAVARRMREARLKEMVEEDEKRLRRLAGRGGRMMDTVSGGVGVALYRVWVSEEAVEGLLKQINAVAEVDEGIMKVGVKRGKGWLEVVIRSDERGARILRALVSGAAPGKVLFVLRFLPR